jgi:hypothetical protein
VPSTPDVHHPQIGPATSDRESIIVAFCAMAIASLPDRICSYIEEGSQPTAPGALLPGTVEKKCQVLQLLVACLAEH